MKNILFAALFLCCFCAKRQTKEEPIPCCVEPTSSKLVGSYCVPGSLKISNIDPSLFLKITPKYFYSDGNKYNISDGSVNTTNKDTFQLYAKLYNDYDYNRTGTFTNILTDTIANLSVLTKYDLNIDYKAGDTINNLVHINYISVYDYIQSRYTKGEVFLSTSLSEFNSKQRLMVKAEDLQLTLPTISPKPAKQQYEVRMRFKSGKVLRDSTSVVVN